MPQEYTVAWVGDQTRPWTSKRGDGMVDFKIALQGREGTLKLTQKQSTTPPQKGDTLYGHIEVEEITPRNGGDPFTVEKFKKDQREGPQRVDANKTARMAGWKGEHRPVANGFDAREARIERMAAHKAAAHLAATYPPERQEAEFTKWLDFLSADLDSYEQARGMRGAIIPEQEVSEAEAQRLLETQEQVPAGVAMPDDSEIPFAPQVI